MKKKKFITAVLLSFTLLTSGCSIGGLNSVINELHGSLVGNSYTIDTYDNYGNKTLETTGMRHLFSGARAGTQALRSRAATMSIRSRCWPSTKPSRATTCHQ